MAQAVELAAQRAADVARQLLAYAGKGQFRVEQLDLSELVRETSELLRITIAQRAALSLELAPHLRHGGREALASVEKEQAQVTDPAACGHPPT